MWQYKIIMTAMVLGSISSSMLLVEVDGEVWTQAKVKGTSMISRSSCWNMSWHVDHVNIRCRWKNLRGWGRWLCKGLWQWLELCIGSFAQTENIRNCLLLLTGCPSSCSSGLLQYFSGQYVPSLTARLPQKRTVMLLLWLKGNGWFCNLQSQLAYTW